MNSMYALKKVCNQNYNNYNQLQKIVIRPLLLLYTHKKATLYRADILSLMIRAIVQIGSKAIPCNNKGKQ